MPQDTSHSSRLQPDLALLAQRYESTGFLFYAVDLANLDLVLDHPRAREGSHCLVSIEGVLPERAEGVAIALGRIMQQASVPRGLAAHIAESYAAKGHRARAGTLRTSFSGHWSRRTSRS